MDQDKQPFEHRHHEGRRVQRGCLTTFIVWSLSFIWIILVGSSDTGSGIKDVITVIAYAVLILLGPAIGILQAIELKSYLDWRSKGGTSWLHRIIIFIGSWLLGLVFAGMGLFLLFNIWFVRRDEVHPKAVLDGVLAHGLCLIFIYIGWKLIQLPFKRISTSTEAQDKADYEKLQHDLAHPDFEALESALGVTLPAAYKAMHRPDSEWYEPGPWVIYPKGLENDEELHMIFGRYPANPAAMRQLPGDPQHYLCFATGEFDEYWILPGTDDPPVYNTVSDDLTRPPSAAEKIADHLSEFLAWPKEDI
jgi:hypothetical protein